MQEYFNYNSMTYREIAYMCLDQLKVASDDSYYTNPNYSLAPNKDAVERDFIS